MCKYLVLYVFRRYGVNQFIPKINTPPNIEFMINLIILLNGILNILVIIITAIIDIPIIKALYKSKIIPSLKYKYVLFWTNITNYTILSFKSSTMLKEISFCFNSLIR